MHCLNKLSWSKLGLILAGLLIVLLIAACQRHETRQISSHPAANCRMIQHALGQVCVPQNPMRLIALDNMTWANAMLLATPTVGVAIPGVTSIDYLEKRVEDHDAIAILGKSDQPSLERILKLKPDLVMGIDFFGEPIFTQLSQIAPTALGEWMGYPSWREYFNFVAQVLGKEEEAQEVWNLYDQRIAEIKAALGNRMQTLEVSNVYAFRGINIDTSTSFVGSIFADIGIRQPTYTATESGVIPLSEEAIPDIDADILFVSVYNADESKEVFAEWQKKPLWQQLKAVREGQVYVVDANVWRAGDPIAAELVLDDLFKYLVENQP